MDDFKVRMKEDFSMQGGAYNVVVFSNGKRNSVTCDDALEAKPGSDHVYKILPASPSRMEAP